MVVILLHGGAEHSLAPAGRRRLTYLRMRLFSRALRRVVDTDQVTLWRLRYRHRGWNGFSQSPVQDADWAIAEATRRHPNAKVVLIGHSMGGRTALRVAGADNVTAVVALAPWLPIGEPITGLAGRRVLIACGDRDRITDPRGSRQFALRAAELGIDVRYQPVMGDGHAMLRQSATWTRLAADTIAAELSRVPSD